MAEWLNKIFIHYSTTTIYMAGFVFAFIAILMAKTLELSFLKRLTLRIKYLREQEKHVWFVWLVTGIILFVVSMLLDHYFATYPQVWYYLSWLLVLAGLLGLIPFSFIERKKKRK